MGKGGFAQALTHKRRELVGRLYLRGNSERAIAEMVRNEASKEGSQLKGCELTTHITVHNDVVECRERWLTRNYAKLDEKRAEQIARYEDIIHQAWVDFTQKKDMLRPQYLRIALEAEDKLAKILGTYAPTKITGDDGEPLIPPVINFHMPDGTVIKPPRNNNGHGEAVTTHGNGSKTT